MTTTIRDIAESLGLSHTTVSRALADHPRINSQTKMRVREAARQMGYVPNGLAQGMRTPHGPVLGLVIPDIQNDFYASIAKIVADAAAARGFHFALSITEDDPEREMEDVRALVSARAAGIIVTPTSSPRPETLAMLCSANVAQLVRRSEGILHEAVLIDDFNGVSSAARHLIAYGHRQIGYVGTRLEISCGRERHDGFRTAMIEHGLDPSNVALGDPRPEFAQHAIASLMATRRLTGLVIGSSSLTIGALEALRNMRIRWPEDVSVVGYGDPVWFRLVGPGLTTIQLPIQEMGKYATSLVLSRFEQSQSTTPMPTQSLHFAPGLVLRGSTRLLSASDKADANPDAQK